MDICVAYPIMLSHETKRLFIAWVGGESIEIVAERLYYQQLFSIRSNMSTSANNSERVPTSAAPSASNFGTGDGVTGGHIRVLKDSNMLVLCPNRNRLYCDRCCQ